LLTYILTEDGLKKLNCKEIKEEQIEAVKGI
jgi:hypothetical protein